jgi:hypothetical protein
LELSCSAISFFDQLEIRLGVRELLEYDCILCNSYGNQTQQHHLCGGTQALDGWRHGLVIDCHRKSLLRLNASLESISVTALLRLFATAVIFLAFIYLFNFSASVTEKPRFLVVVLFPAFSWAINPDEGVDTLADGLFILKDLD